MAPPLASASSSSKGFGTKLNGAQHQQKPKEQQKSTGKGKGRALWYEDALNEKVQEVKDEMIRERKEELETTYGRHDDFVRELFHAEKFKSFLSYNPEVAKKDESPVFQNFKAQYDILDKATPEENRRARTRSNAHSELAQLGMNASSSSRRLSTQPPPHRLGQPSSSSTLPQKQRQSSSVAPSLSSYSASVASSSSKKDNSGILWKVITEANQKNKVTRMNDASSSGSPYRRARSSTSVSVQRMESPEESVSTPTPVPSTRKGKGKAAMVYPAAVRDAEEDTDSTSISTTAVLIQKRRRGRSSAIEDGMASDSVSAATAQIPRKRRGRSSAVEDDLASDPISTATAQIPRKRRGRPPATSVESDSQNGLAASLAATYNAISSKTKTIITTRRTRQSSSVAGAEPELTGPPRKKRKIASDAILLPPPLPSPLPPPPPPLPPPPPPPSSSKRITRGSVSAIPAAPGPLDCASISTQGSSASKYPRSQKGSKQPEPHTGAENITRRSSTRLQASTVLSDANSQPKAAPSSIKSTQAPPRTSVHPLLTKTKNNHQSISAQAPTVPPPFTSNIRRVKLVVRRPPLPISNPQQRPDPPKHGSSLPDFLQSFVTLDLDKKDKTLDQLDRAAKEEAKVWERIRKVQEQGRFPPEVAAIVDSLEMRRPSGTGSATIGAFSSDDYGGCEDGDFLPSTLLEMRNKSSKNEKVGGVDRKPDVWDEIIEQVVDVGTRRLKHSSAVSNFASASGSKYGSLRGARVAGRVASKVQAHFDAKEAKKGKTQQQVEKRLKVLAKSTIKAVVAEWKKAVYRIREEERLKEEIEELRRGHEHLDAILDQSGQILETQHVDLLRATERFKSRSSRSSTTGFTDDDTSAEESDEEDSDGGSDEGATMADLYADTPGTPKQPPREVYVEELPAAGDMYTDLGGTPPPVPEDDESDVGNETITGLDAWNNFAEEEESIASELLSYPASETGETGMGSNVDETPSDDLLAEEEVDFELMYPSDDEEDDLGHEASAATTTTSVTLLDASLAPTPETTRRDSTPPTSQPPALPQEDNGIDIAAYGYDMDDGSPRTPVLDIQDLFKSPDRPHSIRVHSPGLHSDWAQSHSISDRHDGLFVNDTGHLIEKENRAPPSFAEIIDLSPGLTRHYHREDGVFMDNREPMLGVDTMRQLLGHSAEPLARETTEEPTETNTGNQTPISDDEEIEPDNPIPPYLRPYAVAPVQWDPESKVTVPPLLRGVLRPYQQSGLEWLASLHTNHLNGILADEMGLGKTIQTIALLAYLACERGIWGPHIIIVPTSVLLNWEMEFKKFLPGFKTLSYHGSTKRRKELRQGWNDKYHFNVCITSYALASRDAHILKRKPWYYMILDEAHMIKNFKSQRWNILLLFRSFRRLLLTGTPLQNNLTELWALLQFLMSGSTFANLKEFGDWFSNPLEKAIEAGTALDEETQQRVTKLHTLLRPYLLRRLKRDVEKELPSKFEHLMLCPLSKRQRYLYDEYMTKANTKEALQSGSYHRIANILMQLRKVCNHPDLFEVRPIRTSFAMERSAIADYEIKELLIRRRWLQSEEDTVDLGFLGLRIVDRQDKPFLTALETRRLEVTSTMSSPSQLPQGPPPPKDMRTIAGYKRWSEHQRQVDEAEYWEHQMYLNRHRCKLAPLYGSRLLDTLRTCSSVILPATALDCRKQYLDVPETASRMVLSYESREEQMADVIDRFAFATPAVVAPDVATIALAGCHDTIQQQPPSFDAVLHRASLKLQIAFPDPSLLQYDCGKLQRLTQLLREKKAGGHRVLIFTQMTRILDILELFLNFHGYLYLRLDGATKIEDRQYVTELFNADPKIFCFIASSRSGGVGINLTGADTVVFYDSDFNPQMDRQCEDRAHRIGQIRDVHIYRFVSQYTVEEAMLLKADQKRHLDHLVIQQGEFDWRTLFQDEATSAVTRREMADFDEAEDRRAADAAVEEERAVFGEDEVDFEADEAAGAVGGGGGGDARGGKQQAAAGVSFADAKDDIAEVGPDAAEADNDEEGGSIADYMLAFVREDRDFFRDWRI